MNHKLLIAALLDEEMFKSFSWQIVMFVFDYIGIMNLDPFIFAVIDLGIDWERDLTCIFKNFDFF